MKTRLPLAQVEPIARRIVAWLAPACERIEVAGSIRRQQPTVGDIEIVAIPKPILNLFGEPTAESEVDYFFQQQPGIVLKSGPKYKQFYYDLRLEPGRGRIQIDLFLATPDNYGYILMLRTGPAEFSRRMVTLRTQGGLCPPDLECRDGYVWRTKYWDGENWRPTQTICVPEESVLFELWDMNYIQPEERR